MYSRQPQATCMQIRFFHSTPSEQRPHQSQQPVYPLDHRHTRNIEPVTHRSNYLSIALRQELPPPKAFPKSPLPAHHPRAGRTTQTTEDSKASPVTNTESWNSNPDTGPRKPPTRNQKLTSKAASKSQTPTLTKKFNINIPHPIPPRSKSNPIPIPPLLPQPPMTTLTLSPLLPSDFPRLIAHATLHPPGSDLVGQPTPLCCPVHTPHEAHARLAFHFAHQRARYLSDPSVRYMKVELTPATPAPPTISPSPSAPDAASAPASDIISIARWHYYPTGYSFPRDFAWEAHDPDAPGLPEHFNVPLHNYILRARDAARAEWIPPTRPCWILMHMVTHPAYRRRGAAQMLVRWGMQRAGEMGVPAYLEAGVAGVRLYEGLGWERVGGEVVLGLEEGGGEGVHRMCRMRWVGGEGEGGGRGEE